MNVNGITTFQGVKFKVFAEGGGGSGAEGRGGGFPKTRRRAIYFTSF